MSELDEIKKIITDAVIRHSYAAEELCRVLHIIVYEYDNGDKELLDHVRLSLGTTVLYSVALDKLILKAAEFITGEEIADQQSNQEIVDIFNKVKLSS